MTRQSRSTIVVAATVVAAVGAIAAAMPAHAVPVTFAILGGLDCCFDLPGFPVGSDGSVSVRLSYDPDLATAPSPGAPIRLEDSAQLSVRFGNLAVDLTGADGLFVTARGWSFHLMTPFLPPGRLPFTTDSTFVVLSLTETFAGGPGPFDGLTHAPYNLDAIHPPDFGVQLSRVTQDGFRSLHGILSKITPVPVPVPEPATIAILLVGLAGLTGLTRYAGAPRPRG